MQGKERDTLRISPDDDTVAAVLQGRDLMGLAQTGTGKTAAFGLPLLHRILDLGHPPGPRHVRALILAPTRELVGQIHDNFMVFTKGTPTKLTMVVGGASIVLKPENISKLKDCGVMILDAPEDVFGGVLRSTLLEFHP